LSKRRNVLIVGNSFHLLSDDEKMRFSANGINIGGIGVCGIKNYYSLLNSIEPIVSNNQEINFIYRPHPSFIERELNNEDLKKLVENNKNFSLDKSGAISTSILNSSLIFSFHSTSYLEAVACDKPFVIIRFHGVPVSDELPDLIDWPLVINAKEDIERYVEMISRGIFVDDYKSKYDRIKETYFINDGLVSKKLLGFISKFMVDGAYISYKLPVHIALKHRLLFIVKYFTNFLSLRSGLVRRVILASKDYRIQNLAYMWGLDAFDKDYFKK